MNIGDVVGNKWRIIGICTEKANDGHKLFNAECVDCGFRKDRVLLSTLKANKGSCNHFIRGCYWHSARLRSIYSSMFDRCYNSKNSDYVFYGAKGIRICDEWINNKQAFNDWAIENGYEEGLTIDRIDPDKDYSPENCRWVTAKYNSKWKSTTHYITVNGITDSGKGWARRLGLGINFINRYIRNRGMSECIRFIEENIK